MDELQDFGKQRFVIGNSKSLEYLTGLLRQNWRRYSEAGRPLQIVIEEEKRTNEQNSLMWVILGHLSQRKKWPVNGVECFMTPAEWKDVLSAAFLRETIRFAQGVYGGVVMLGARTSNFPKGRMSEFNDWLMELCREWGIPFTPVELKALDPRG